MSSLKIHKRGGVWHYRGTVAGHRLRGSTRTADRKEATRIASEIENRQWKRGFDTVEQALTFPKAVTLYLAAGKPDRYIDRLEDYWKNTRVTDVNSGAIKQSAMALYPYAKGSTRNRQVIVPTQAIINHCAELQLCQPIKIARFKFETKIKQPATLEWVVAFRAHADRADVGVLALFMLATGARIQEALAVQWDDVNIRKRTVLIRQSKLGNEREAHLPHDLLIAIANLPRRNEPKLAKPFAFAGHSSALAAWQRAIAAAGIEPLPSIHADMASRPRCYIAASTSSPSRSSAAGNQRRTCSRPMATRRMTRPSPIEFLTQRLTQSKLITAKAKT